MLRLDAGPGGDFHGSLELGASFVAEQPAARRAAPLCVDGFGLCLELHAFLSHLKKINEEITVLWWLFFMCFICCWLDIVWDQSVCSSNPELAAISGVSEVMLLKFGNFPWPPGLMKCRLYLVWINWLSECVMDPWVKFWPNGWLFSPYSSRACKWVAQGLVGCWTTLVEGFNQIYVYRALFWIKNQLTCVTSDWQRVPDCAMVFTSFHIFWYGSNMFKHWTVRCTVNSISLGDLWGLEHHSCIWVAIGAEDSGRKCTFAIEMRVYTRYG